MLNMSDSTNINWFMMSIKSEKNPKDQGGSGCQNWAHCYVSTQLSIYMYQLCLSYT